jgi:hypothetical protein
MKASTFAIGILGLLIAAPNAWAGRSSTSASASSDGRGPGSAAATAEYDGNGIGYTRTNTRSGRINFGQGISLGFDEEGLTFSTSYAVAPQRGPAAAGTFNLAIGTDGSVSHGVGQTVAYGDRTRSVEAGGFARPGSRGNAPAAGATVGGSTGPRGRVIAQTHTATRRATVIRAAAHWVRRGR